MRVSVNGESPISWSDFLQTNDIFEDGDEARAIHASLQATGIYEVGGGGAAGFKIEVITNLLARAIQNDDQDAAIALIAKALGITEGDVAGQVFSGPDNDSAAWRAASADWRKRQIGKWLNAECLYAAEG